MLIIETEYANFGSFKDLHIFMKQEGLTEVTATTKYVGSVVNTLKLTLDEVEEIANK